MARLGPSSLILLILFGFGNSFYFELSDKGHVQRCFLEEVEESATFKGTYKAKNYHDKSHNTDPGSVFIRVIDPNGQDMVQREYKDKGSFAFFSGSFGTYEICFLKLPTESDVTTRVYLHYELSHQDDENDQFDDQPEEHPDETPDKKPEERRDETTDKKRDDEPEEQNNERDGEQEKEQPDPDENDMKENSTRVESTMEKLLVRVEENYDHIWKMYHRFKKREKLFRELSTTTNSRIIWWAIFQVIVLLVMAAWQMRHLTKFFILKKIV